MASVRIEKLCKTFDEKTNVVDDVSVCIRDNEFVVIVGPSGCGKTTTLNIIAGLEKPSSGHIFIDDECVDDVEPKDRNIAMVFQTHTLYPHLSVKDNLAFPLRIRRCDKELIEQRVSSTAEMLGISALLSRKPRQLSGGQMQRVAIGKAIVREPKVFLMDEPLSNLDASLKTQMREELKRIHQKIDSTFIYVTHDQVEAMTLATTLIVMNMGKIQQIGSPYEVFSKPSNLFVSSFIGSFPMNFIECEINDTSDKRKSVCVFGDDIQFTLSQNTLNKLVVGIRAEDLLVDFNSPGEPSEISSYEVLGSNTLLKCKLCNGISVSVLTNTDMRFSRRLAMYPIGDGVDITFALEAGVKKNEEFQVRSRMILRKSTLINWIEIIQAGPLGTL